MDYKIMIAGDLHKRMKDITTIRGYTDACKQVQLDLMQTIREKGITHFISLGDWFDGGYGSDVAAALVHTDIDREMSELLNGNFYGLIGNHIRIKMDSNPELFLIQPHPVYKSRHDVSRAEQIIKTPDRLVLNNVEFILNHWNPLADSARDYKKPLDTNCKFHIGLYHTEQIIPAQLLAGLNMGYNIESEQVIADALDGIDIAIVGHIHKVIGSHIIKNTSTAGGTNLIVPGSLSNTDAGSRTRHDSIKIPIITACEDGTMKFEYHEQSLHLEMLTFLRKQIDEDTKNRLKSISGNSKETLYDEMQTTAFIGDTNQFMSLNRFMSTQGYTHEDKVQIRSVIKNPEDIDTLVYIGKGKDDILQ